MWPMLTLAALTLLFLKGRPIDKMDKGEVPRQLFSLQCYSTGRRLYSVERQRQEGVVFAVRQEIY